MQKSITVTAMNRPALLQALLHSLMRNELDGWRISVAIEPSSAAADLVGICKSVLAGQNHEIKVNNETLGIRANPHRALNRAFAAGSALNLYLEEDLLVSPDATAMALWYAENHKPAWLCLNLLAGPCGSAALISDSRFPEQLFLAHTFNSIGFVVRREEWHGLMAPNWFGGGLPELAGGPTANWGTYASGWDWSIYRLLATRNDLFSIQPVFARATHTGATGTNATPEFHDKVFGGLPISKKPADTYALVETDDLNREVRSLVRAHEEMTELRLQLEKRARVAGGALARLAEQRHKGGGKAWALRRWSSKTLKRILGIRA